MFDRGHVFRRFTRLPADFASQSDGTCGRASAVPVHRTPLDPWSRLSVDGELRMNAHMRAATHLSMCADCGAEVDAQRQARAALREPRTRSTRRHRWSDGCHRFRSRRSPNQAMSATPPPVD